MNFKKIVSAVSALAISVSAFAGLAVTAQAASNEETATVVRLRTWSADNKNKTQATDDTNLKFGVGPSSKSSNYPCMGALQFSFENADNAEVESAVLTYTATVSNTDKSNHNVYSAANAGVDFSQVPVLSESAENQNGIYTQTASSAQWTYNSAILGELTSVKAFGVMADKVVNEEVDVTDYVKAQAQAGTNYATFVFSNSARGGSITNYALNITYKVSAESAATVTLNYVDGNGDAIADPVTVDNLVVGDSFDPSAYAPATLTQDLTDSNGTYHQDYAYGSADTIASLEANNTVNVTYATSGDPYVYVTWQKGTKSTDQFTEHNEVEKVTKSDTEHRYNYQKYLNHDGAVYSYSGNGAAYKCTPNKDQTRFLNYSLVSDAVFFCEGENYSKAEWFDNNASYSGGKAGSGYMSPLYTLTSTEGGIYSVTVAGKNSNKRGIKIQVDGTDVTEQLYLPVTEQTVTVPAGSTLKVITGSTSNAAVDYVDYVLIQKTADLPSVSATSVVKEGYITFKGTIKDVDDIATVTKAGFGFVNLGTEVGSTELQALWTNNKVAEDKTFGAAIEQQAEAEKSAFYGIPYIVIGNEAVFGTIVASDWNGEN